MSRINWRNFRMIIAADAQMENWSHFDTERLLEKKCQVLRSAHHGSGMGTQWERIFRLSPDAVIISSDLKGGNKLPDITGAAIFAKFDSKVGQFAAIIRNTGTIHLRVSSGGHRRWRRFEEERDDNVPLEDEGEVLSEIHNPTNWIKLLNERRDALSGE